MRLKCKMVGASSEILHIHTKSLHRSMYPIVKINYSTPALNTHSHKWALLQNIDLAHVQAQAQQQGETNNYLHLFTLPNNLDNNSIVRLLQNDTTAYQLEYAGNNIVDAWKEVKREKVRKRKQRELRKKAEKMVKLHRELNRALCQAHKLSTDGRGLPM